LADIQRYKDRDKDVILLSVSSGVTVEIGDLMFRDSIDNLRNDGSSTANNRAYPLKYLRVSGASLELNKRQAKNYFVGVSLGCWDGVGDTDYTLNIPIATHGVFSYELKPAKTVDVGNYVSPSGSTSGSDMYNQKVMKTTESLNAIGYFSRGKLYAKNADVIIKTALSRKGKIE
jgi:hypothetical protein